MELSAELELDYRASMPTQRKACQKAVNYRTASTLRMFAAVTATGAGDRRAAIRAGARGQQQRPPKQDPLGGIPCDLACAERLEDGRAGNARSRLRRFLF